MPHFRSLTSISVRMARRAGCLAPVALLVAGLPLAGCSTIENLNPFAPEKYQTKILPDVPADDIYNQGLARLQKKDSGGAAKKFDDLDKSYPFSDYSRKGLLMETYANYQGGKYDDAI